MKLQDLLSEKVINRHPVITLNPSRGEYNAVLNGVKRWRSNIRDDEDGWSAQDDYPIRALIDIDTQDLYLWDAYDAAHGAIIDNYGIRAGMHLMIADNFVLVLTLWRYERLGYSYEDIHEMVKNNKFLNRLFPKGFDIKIEA